jgi:ribosomal protein L14E/L6E/L27E
MAEQSYELFRVVESKAGRDKKRLFAVVGFRADGLVLLADGDLRKLAKPKLKKKMHLKARPWVLENLAELHEKGMLKDSDIRRELMLIDINRVKKEQTEQTEIMEGNTFGQE